MPHLSRIWVGMLTRNSNNSGTNSNTVIIINNNGEDRYHHTFLDTPQDDQEKGEANLYTADVLSDSINTSGLNNSSVRIGIRGNDLWRPEHYFVWGTLSENNNIVPIAIETDLTTVLSGSLKEGRISLPLRLVELGDEAMRINRLLVLMTTADKRNAGTNSKIEIEITSQEGAIIVDFEIPDTPQDEQERASANLYFIEVDTSFSKNSLNADSIRLRIKGQDAWLPESFFIFGLDTVSRRPETITPLVHIEDWNLGKLSTDSNEGESSVLLPLINN